MAVVEVTEENAENRNKWMETCYGKYRCILTLDGRSRKKKKIMLNILHWARRLEATGDEQEKQEMLNRCKDNNYSAICNPRINTQ